MKSGIRYRTKVKCGIRFASKFGTRSWFSFLIVAACSSHQQHAIPATHTYRKLSFVKVHPLLKAKPCNEWSFRSPKSDQQGGKGARNGWAGSEESSKLFVSTMTAFSNLHKCNLENGWSGELVFTDPLWFTNPSPWWCFVWLFGDHLVVFCTGGS